MLIAADAYHAQDARWVYYGKSADKAKYYYDTNVKEGAPTVQPPGVPFDAPVLTTWIKIIRTGRSYSLGLYEFLCKQGQGRFVRSVNYSSNGQVTSSVNDPSSWSVPVPESLGERALNAVCNFSSPRTEPDAEPAPPRISIPTAPNLDAYRVRTVKEARITENDVGADIARITTPSANLRSEPNVKSTVIRELPRGRLLVVLDMNPVLDWYNVIDLETSDEGWVHKSTIEVQFTRNRKVSNPDVTGVAAERSDSSPYAMVFNNSAEVLHLKIGTRNLVIQPGATERADFTAGAYKFYATAPGVIPDMGEITFGNGMWYTWRFYIKTVVH